MNLKSMTRLATITGLLAVLISTSALAGTDGKTFPGAACQTRSPEAEFVRRNSILNAGTASMAVICPVVRDTFAANTLSSAAISVVDRHPTQNISCRLFSFSRNGQQVGFAQKNSAGNSTTAQRLTFGSLPSDLAGHYFFECTLPGLSNGDASSIDSYEIIEKD